MKTAVCIVAIVLVALGTRKMEAIEVSTQQVQIDVKIAPISSTISKEMVSKLPALTRNPTYDFLKFIGPGSIDTTKMIGHTNPLRTINTAPGASSSVTTNGIRFNFVPTFDGGGTSIRMEITPEEVRDLQPYRGNFTVPGGSSLLIGFHPPKAAPGRDQILIITPSLLPTESGTHYTTTATTTTAPGFSRWELSASYNFMQADEEVVKSLHGFNVTGYYNFNPHVAAAVQVGGYYGTASWNAGFEKYDMYLDRYNVMVGPRFQCTAGAPVRPYGQVLFGAVWDYAGLNASFPGYENSSATAFGMSIGGGINFDITSHFSITPSIDWFPTFFDGQNSRQDNWRIGLGGAWRF